MESDWNNSKNCAFKLTLCKRKLESRYISYKLYQIYELQNGPFCWFGHVVRNDSCINSITALEVDRHNGPGRPRKKWRDTIDYCKYWKLTRVDSLNRIEWRIKIIANMEAVAHTK